MEKQKLPNSQGALILGITSIITACCCYGIPGVILGFIGLNQAKKAKRTHDENPDVYIGIGNANTGRITSIIGLVIGGLYTIFMIYIISTGQWGDVMDQYKELIEQAQQNQ